MQELCRYQQLKYHLHAGEREKKQLKGTKRKRAPNASIRAEDALAAANQTRMNAVALESAERLRNLRDQYILMKRENDLKVRILEEELAQKVLDRQKRELEIKLLQCQLKRFEEDDV